MTPPRSFELEEEIADILSSRKYRDLHLPEVTIHSLLQQELAHGASPAAAVKRVRQKLHNIVAPYLGDPDFRAAAAALNEARASGEEQTWQQVCLQILSAHSSTRERIPILPDFYTRLFEVTGLPASILDLACGLNPFAIPWMGLDSACLYHAYDINQPRVDLINHFLKIQGLEPLAFCQDILVAPPPQEAEVAFFFKEAHRFEQRQRHSNTTFWQSLKVRWLLVSLPTSSLSGRHNLLERQRALVYGALKGFDWQVTEVIFASEIVFCIQKKRDR